MNTNSINQAIKDGYDAVIIHPSLVERFGKRLAENFSVDICSKDFLAVDQAAFMHKDAITLSHRHGDLS